MDTQRASLMMTGTIIWVMHGFSNVSLHVDLGGAPKIRLLLICSKTFRNDSPLHNKE